MRLTDTISSTHPVGFMSLTFEANAIEISNPTLSPILYRQGGTDFPLESSADFIIPAQSLVRLPALGNSFGYGFDNTALLGNGPVRTAKITALDRTEATSVIGSIQPVARPAYFEKERNPITLGNFTRDITLTNANPAQTITIYTCPANRKARIASAQIEFYSTGPFTAGFTDVVGAFIEVPSVQTPATPSIVCQLQNIVTGTNQSYNRALSVDYVLNPGDTVLYVADSVFRPTTFNYDLIMAISLTEFDF